MLGEESFSMKDIAWMVLIKGEKVLSEDTVQEMVHSFLFSGLEKEKSLLIKNTASYFTICCTGEFCRCF